MADEEIEKADKIFEVIDFLTTAVDRIQIFAEVPAGVINDESSKAAALRLCGAICNYLTAAIKDLKHSGWGILCYM